MAKKEVAVIDSTELAVSNDLPDWLQGKGAARGSENVTTDDMLIPRIELVQALSPARKKSDAAYIEGAEEGMLYNNVTRELYGESVRMEFRWATGTALALATPWISTNCASTWPTSCPVR